MLCLEHEHCDPTSCFRFAKAVFELQNGALFNIQTFSLTILQHYFRLKWKFVLRPLYIYTTYCHNKTNNHARNFSHGISGTLALNLNHIPRHVLSILLSLMTKDPLLKVNKIFLLRGFLCNFNHILTVSSLVELSAYLVKYLDGFLLTNLSERQMDQLLLGKRIRFKPDFIFVMDLLNEFFTSMWF